MIGRGCTPECWTPQDCPDHPGHSMKPVGRDAAEHHPCCDNERDPNKNSRHLWSIHDSTRYYTDPEGWNKHERECRQCSGDDD